MIEKCMKSDSSSLMYNQIEIKFAVKLFQKINYGYLQRSLHISKNWIFLFELTVD